MASGTSFELWDVSSGNLINWFDTQDEALALVRTAIANHSRRYVSRWALLALDGDGDGENDLRTIAQGAALAKLAVQSVPA